MNWAWSSVGRAWGGADWGRRVATLFLGFVGFLAVAADLIASDLPLACRYRGRFYLLPCLTRPGALRGLDNELIDASPGSWVLPPLVPYGPRQTTSGGRLEVRRPPSRRHLLGTDESGRDVLAQLVHGARTALAVGVLSVLLYVGLGTLLGVAAAALGGVVDGLVSWATAVLVAFPTLLVLLAVCAAVGGGLWSMVLAIGLTGWPNTARLVRSKTASVLSEAYVQAAKVSGVGLPRILANHVLPRLLPLLATSATLGVAWGAAAESAVGFFGLGGDHPSWGRIVASARTDLTSWWLLVFPSVLLVLLVLSCASLARRIETAGSAGGSRMA